MAHVVVPPGILDAAIGAGDFLLGNTQADPALRVIDPYVPVQVLLVGVRLAAAFRVRRAFVRRVVLLHVSAESSGQAPCRVVTRS